MGCHTWFYKKIESPSEETMKARIKDKCKEEIAFLNQLIYDREKIDQTLLKAYPEWTPEYAKEIIPHWENLIKYIEGKKIDISETIKYFFDTELEGELICNIYASLMSDDWILKYVKGKGFYLETEFHDIFRKYGYPEDKLFSLEETLQYINNPENECSISDKEYTIKELKKFWKKYPNGMIRFG